MASLTMMASFVGGVTAAKRPWINHRRSPVMAKAAGAGAEAREVSKQNSDIQTEEGSESRRAVMFAAAVAAIGVVGAGRSVAMAIDEPKRGTLEAKKKYAPVCVTMPTAKICHK